jgi:putative membrane protein
MWYPYIAFALIAGIAAAHVAFMYFEMFRWNSSSVRVAGLDPTVAEATKALGFNQGLYNGFLALGLVWSLCAPATYDARLAVFFLGCVFVAGVGGDITIKPCYHSILIVQTVFATLALVALWASGGVILPKCVIF